MANYLGSMLIYDTSFTFLKVKYQKILLSHFHDFRKSEKKKKKQQLDIEQLNEVDVIKPLKPQENGVHEKQNG